MHRSNFLKKEAFSPLKLIIFIAIFGAIGGYLLFSSYATSNMTGASLGICNPSPCTAGTLPASFPAVNQVSLGTINNDWANENYIYHYYVPRGLACTGAADCSAADPNHKPAAVFVASGSGGYPNNASGIGAFTDSGWQHVADANQLIIIILDWPTNCVSQVINNSGVITTPGTEITCGGWQRPKTTCDMYNGTAPNYVRWNYNIDGAGAGGTVAPSGNIFCDASGNNAADRSSSVPYVVALVNNAVSRFGLDPSRLYFTGASSGGALTRELFCDSRSSNLFRGYAIISNGTNSVPNGTAGSCPNSANRNFFVQYVSGTNASQDPYNTSNLANCVIGATGLGSNPCTHEQMGFTDSRNWTASYFGCGPPTITGIPGSLTTNVIYDYHCIYGASPQVEFISVGNGGHTWPCLDAVPQVPCAGKTTNPTNGFNTAQSNWAFFAGTTTGSGTPTADTTPPSTPTNLSLAGSTANSISLTWTASTDNVGVTGYDLYKNGAASGTTASSSATFGGLTCGTSYTLAVNAFDAAGNKSAQASGSFNTGACASDTTPPTVPGNIQFSATVSSITLKWNAATDNVGVAGYRLYKNGGLITTTTALTYTFTGLACGTNYTVGVTAFDAANNESSLTSGQSMVSTAACLAASGDLNGDGRVDFLDLSILATDYGTSNAAADLNKDGRVDFLDLSIMASSWGQ